MNYSSNVILNPEENNRFQTIYASQSYSTFYAVFARFTMIDIVNNGQVVKGKKLLQQIDLKLINYKGLINMKFAEISEIDPNAIEVNSGNSTLLLKINVKGSAGDSNTESLNPENSNVAYSYTVHSDTEHSISINEPIEVNNGTYFTVVRELFSLSGHNKNSGDMKPYVSGVFDDEYFYRDGLLRRKREVVGFSLEEETDEVPGSRLQTVIDLNYPGRRCIKGVSKISIG